MTLQSPTPPQDIAPGGFSEDEELALFLAGEDDFEDHDWPEGGDELDAARASAITGNSEDYSYLDGGDDDD